MHIIPPTQGQALDNIENPSFATPSTSTSRSSSENIPSQTLTPQEQLNRDLYPDDTVDDEVPDLTQFDVKFDREICVYESIKFNREQKQKLDVLDLWKNHKSQFPCLYQAAKALLHTPATSVPSERIFSEAGYVSRARRSRILSINLNKNLFIKNNIKYVPDVTKFLTERQAQEALGAADENMSDIE